MSRRRYRRYVRRRSCRGCAGCLLFIVAALGVLAATLVVLQ